MNFTNAAALLELCQKNGSTLAQEMLRREITHLGTAEHEAHARMQEALCIMKAAVQRSLQEKLTSMGGLIGGEARRLEAYRAKATPVCGDTLARACTYAMGVLEVNASMGLIVAAPTAGSSGVLPGVLLALQEDFNFSAQEMEDALWAAGAVGYLLMRNATVAGAQGGCQAEVGAASAMAAAGATQLRGGTPAACLSAASLALSNLLGLVCDPIAGLVEAPCQTRNALGAANALTCAQIALSGIPALVPFDEMVDAMYRVGRSIPFELRETALGGCAATPTGCALCNHIFKQEAL